MFAGTASFANVATNEIKTNETKTELVLTSTVSTDETYTNYTNYDEDCEWTLVTRVKTRTYFVLGYAVLVTISTYTVLECR